MRTIEPRVLEEEGLFDLKNAGSRGVEASSAFSRKYFKATSACDDPS